MCCVFSNYKGSDIDQVALSASATIGRCASCGKRKLLMSLVKKTFNDKNVIYKNHMNTKKDNVIVAHGHLYLFWSAGVYYSAELAAKYNVVFLVPEEYRYDDKFQSVCKHLQVSEISYYEYSGKNPFQHFTNCRLFKLLLGKYKPAFVVQHDYIGIDNMYLFHWTKKLLPKCLKIVMLTSFPSNENTKKFNAQFVEMSVNRYATRLRLPSFIVGAARKLVVHALSFWNNILIPIVALWEKPYFPLSENANIDIVPSRPLYDYYFFYDSCEKNYMDRLLTDAGLFQNVSHQVIRTPIIDTYNVNTFLYNEQEQDLVSIFPSLIGLRDFEEEEATLQRWVEALNLLRDQLPHFDFVIKFHPGNNSPQIEAVKAYFKNNCSFLQVYERQERAEALMLNSKVIVGDVSSTLWWSNFRPKKIVISLGMQDFEGSKDMSYYPEILYIEKMSDLSKIDVHTLVLEQDYESCQKNHPLLTDVLELVSKV